MLVPTKDLMVTFAMLSKVLEAAQLLAAVGVLREEDVKKCVRVYVKKHPEINEYFASQGINTEERLGLK
jgi:hypothetical protein